MSPCLSHDMNVSIPLSSACLHVFPMTQMSPFLSLLHVSMLVSHPHVDCASPHHTHPCAFPATTHVSMPWFYRCVSDYSVPVREPHSHNAGCRQARCSLSPPWASSCLASTLECPGMNYWDQEDNHCSGCYGGDRPFQSNKGGFCNGASKKTFSACAICLGRHSHKIVKCASPHTWDQIHLTLAC